MKCQALPFGHHRRRGLSLLEVVLALAILGIAVGILAQAMQISADNALRSQFRAQAQLICESKMSELLAGAIPIQPQDWAPVSGFVGTGSWYFSIQTLQGPQPDLIGVVLTVTDRLDLTSTASNHYSLYRLIIDPNLGLDQNPTQTGTQSSSGGSSGSSTSSSTSASGG